MNSNEIITASGLTMHYRGCSPLRGVDLAVKRGTVFALLGENGVGKTTLIKILTGFQTPTSGECHVCGLNPQHDALEIRRRIGYVSDAPALYEWMTVAQIGWFAAAFYPAGFMERYQSLINGYQLPADRKIKVLSKGQRAKVALSLALGHDPELLILDEPTSGLDPLVRREFLESMVDRASTGRTVLLSSHQIGEVERVADTIAILHDGKFKLCGELVKLKDEISEVTVSVEDPLLCLPMPSAQVEILSEQTQGRQRRYVIRGFDQETQRAWSEYMGVQSVKARPASLEELFIACTRGLSAEKRDNLPGTMTKAEVLQP